MEAPEKIWINPSMDLPKLNGVLDKDSVEYIRKDAFIEKVCKFLDDRIKHDSIDYPMATNHLIEDFKNYMKGG